MDNEFDREKETKMIKLTNSNRSLDIAGTKGESFRRDFKTAIAVSKFDHFRFLLSVKFVIHCSLSSILSNSYFRA